MLEEQIHLFWVDVENKRDDSFRKLLKIVFLQIIPYMVTCVTTFMTAIVVRNL